MSSITRGAGSGPFVLCYVHTVQRAPRRTRTRTSKNVLTKFADGPTHMGAGASLPADLPESIDKKLAQTVLGSRFDAEAFDAAAADSGTVTRAQFYQAAAATAGTDEAKHNDEVVQTALSLAREKRGDDFLGCEVREKTDQETLFLEAWQHIDRGELRQAIGKADALLSLDQTGEKFYYTRAIAYARLAEFRSACADFSAYLKHVQLVKGPQLANAYYGCTPARGGTHVHARTSIVHVCSPCAPS